MHVELNYKMIDQPELKEIESKAIEIASNAGELLLQYFDKPLSVDYKSANGRNPVTDADHAADELIRKEISKYFPSHTTVTEETENTSNEIGQFTWVVDPLDGTTNFLHGLPIFASMLCLLLNGIPVVSAVYLPKIGSAKGTIYHASHGGGTFENNIPVRLDNSEQGRLMASVPGYFLRMFNYHKSLRGKLGDIRSLGSAGFELVMTAKGTTDYMVSSGPRVWDIAPGLLLILEAGGAALVRNKNTRNWENFESFCSSPNIDPSPEELRDWKETLILGKPYAVEKIASGLSVRSYPLRSLRNKINAMTKHF